MEGLIHTSKDKEEGSGGKTANFFVAIAFDKGVITCEQYHSKLTGTMFAEFVKEHFSDVFKSVIQDSALKWLVMQWIRCRGWLTTKVL